MWHVTAPPPLVDALATHYRFERQLGAGGMATVYLAHDRKHTALRVKLSASEDGRLAERPIKDARAFELYLKAQVLTRRYGASMEQVNALVERAIEIEGESPPLRALRAYLWVTQVRAGMSTDHEHLVRAEREARALLDFSPDAAYGYSLLGFISFERGDMADAVRYLATALERDRSTRMPGSSTASRSGRWDKATPRLPSHGSFSRPTRCPRWQGCC